MMGASCARACNWCSPSAVWRQHPSSRCAVRSWPNPAAAAVLRAKGVMWVDEAMGPAAAAAAPAQQAASSGSPRIVLHLSGRKRYG